MAVRSPAQTMEKTIWKILIIDDDEDDFVIARDMLKEAKGRKFDIQWADTYAAGREELISNHYHAVLVDYDLGIHSGIELIREANERGYASPLILFTGRGSYEVDVEAMEAGATMYLTKGEVNALLLERAIRYAIEIKQRENDLREARETVERELVERKRVEEALRNSEAILRKSEATLRRIDARWNAAIESLNVGVIIATEDEQVIYWNPAARQMHTFTRPDEGIEPLEKTPITFQLWTPDGSHLLALDEWPMRRIKRGEPVSNLELRIRRPDQGWEKVFSYSGVMVDTTGGERLIFLTCQDLTEKRRIEDALRESEERLRLALNTARMVAWEYDPVTLQVTLSENAEQVLELPQRHENSDQGYSLIHPEDVEKHRALVTRAIETGGSYVSVYRHLHGEQVLWMEEHGQAVVDPSGKTIRLVGVMQNITSRIEAEAAFKANAEALKDSQDRLVEFVENLHNNYIALDHDWRFTYANRHYGQVMGVDPRTLIGKKYWELFPQYIGTELEQNYRKVMTEKVPFHYIQRGIYTQNVYEVSLFPTKEGLAIFSIDRTEELRHQQQLEDERARLDTILQALPVGVWITDAEGKIIEKNEQTDRIWAGQAPLVEGIDQYPAYQSWDARTGKQLAPEEYPVAIAVQTGQPADQKELRIRRFDGSEGFVLVSATPIKDSEGRLVGAAGINLDISERKRAELLLKESNDALQSALEQAEKGRLLLETLLENAPEGITITGGPPDFRIERVSRYGRELTNRPASPDLVGLKAGEHQDAWGIFLPDGETRPTKEQMPLYRASHYGELIRNQEMVIIRGDGEHIPVLVSAVPIRDDQGQIRGAINTWRDITELKQAEKALLEREETLARYSEQLARSNEELEEFAFVASHDLQEPLRKVIMFGNSLSRHLDDAPDKVRGTAKEYLNRMQDAAGRMQAMINGLLDLSRVNTQGREFMPLNLTQVVGEVVEDLEARIQAANGQVKIETLPRVMGDAVQIRALFQNLIGNALKFHKLDVQPVVRVSGTINQTVDTPMAEIRVEDNGIGFELEYANRIFQPFQRLHGKSEYEGTGLGLAICQKIVERHHGTVEVESVPGKGSTFIIRLPTR